MVSALSLSRALADQRKCKIDRGSKSPAGCDMSICHCFLLTGNFRSDKSFFHSRIADCLLSFQDSHSAKYGRCRTDCSQIFFFLHYVLGSALQDLCVLLNGLFPASPGSTSIFTSEKSVFSNKLSAFYYNSVCPLDFLPVP